jgi:hypothetical protein
VSHQGFKVGCCCVQVGYMVETAARLVRDA